MVMLVGEEHAWLITSPYVRLLLAPPDAALRDGARKRLRPFLPAIDLIQNMHHRRQRQDWVQVRTWRELADGQPPRACAAIDRAAQRLALGNGAVDQPADDVDAIALRLRVERLLRVGREPNDFFGLPKRRGRLLQERHARIPISEVLRRRQARRRRELKAR